MHAAAGSKFTMLSWLFGEKTKLSPSNGIGFGGDFIHGHDSKKLAEGRTKAALEKANSDASTVRYLIQMVPLLHSKSLPDSSKLAATLKEIFCNQDPLDWEKEKKLLSVSLECFRLVILYYSELVGDRNDADSLCAAFDAFAQNFQSITKYDGGRNHDEFVDKVMGVHQSMMTMQHNTQADLLETDPREHYRKELGLLRFDFADVLLYHHFSSRPKSAGLSTRKLFQELSSYKFTLPIDSGSSIFTRAVEGRLDLLRALIIGPDDTPYANGCFFFDIYLNNYPDEPPKVQFLTTGRGNARFNPNLYENGKVCLSLLGTWNGPGWIKGESTLLQILVSIQSLIFVEEPFFNEPGNGFIHQHFVCLTKKSVDYNANIRKLTLQHAILPFLSGHSFYPEFDDVMKQHFRLKRMLVEQQMNQWIADDSSLSGIVKQISSTFAQLDKKRKTRRAKTDKMARGTAMKVVEILENDGSPARKKRLASKSGADIS
jgi:ubiquitin-protein ligase